MKYSLLLLLFIVNFSVFSQNNNGKVYYTVTPIEIPSNKNNISADLKVLFHRRYKKKLEIAKDIEYELIFNKTQSIFKASKFGMDGLMWFKTGIIYTHIYGEKIKEVDMFGSTFLITSNNKIVNWKFINESKKIGKYICHKATTIKTIINSKGTFYRNITAWYCTDLPISFGPMGYGNLPGLILELKIENKGIYSFNKLVLNLNEDIKIKKPIKGKIVTEQEFSVIVEKMYNKRKNGK